MGSSGDSENLAVSFLSGEAGQKGLFSPPSVFWCRGLMEVLSGPWADVALLLRQTIAQTDGWTDGLWPLWLFGLLLFLSVCLLLLQLIVYLSWKLRRGREAIHFSCLLTILH